MNREGRAAPIREGSFHVFVYGTLRSGGEAHERIADCEFVKHAHVLGTLYDIDELYPALMLYGSTRIEGEIWRCPARRLAALDEFESVAKGLFRRAGALIDDVPCWIYVAGPALARHLTPEQRIDDGRWVGRAGAEHGV